MVFQQEAASEEQPAVGAKGVAKLALTVVRRKAWLLATLVDFAGFLLQATALHLGRVTVVQPLLVSVLVFGMLIGARRSGVRLAGPDLGGALLVCAGLAGFLLAAQPPDAGNSLHPLRGRLPALLAAVLLAAAVSVVAAPRLGPAPSAVAQGLGAGLCFAGVAAVVKTVGEQLVSGGPLHVLANWQVYGLAVVALTGLAVEQAAFAAGPLVPTLVVLTLIDPLASLAIGAGVFGEGLRGGAGAVLGAVVAGVAVTTGVVLVARSPATSSARQTGVAAVDETNV